jgi:hippurate hydrolase
MTSRSGIWLRQERAAALLSRMVEHRRHLHAHPEVGLELPATHEYVADHLRALGLSPEVRAAGGITARIRGRSPRGRPRILRSDMDALPLQERTGLAFSSATPGAMHACGQDLHMAMLLGAAELFVIEPPAHDVVLAFQPGEEADRGALAVLEHETLRALPPDAVAFAIHVNAVIPSGVVTSRPGCFMAYGDWFRVAFAGPGGHASAPHLTGNPIDAMASWTRGLHALVAELRVREPLVATVTEAIAGNTVNIIPTNGTLRGTLRTLSEEGRAALHERLAALTRDVAASFGLRETLLVIDGYPAVMNDPAVLGALIAAHDAERPELPAQEMPEPSMVIEDFAYFLRRWPGAMVYLGAQVDSRTSFNHSDDVVFDESVMTVGLALHSLAVDLPF